MRRLWFLGVVLFVASLLLLAGHATQRTTDGHYLNFFGGKAYDVRVGGDIALQPQPTNTPQQIVTPPQWHVLLDVSGDGSKKTVPLTVPSEWRIQWACDPTSNYFGDYNVIVSVYTTDGFPLDIASVNSMCKKNSTSGETEEYGAGQVYLDIVSEGTWALHVTGLA